MPGYPLGGEPVFESGQWRSNPHSKSPAAAGSSCRNRFAGNISLPSFAADFPTRVPAILNALCLNASGTLSAGLQPIKQT